MSEQNQKPPAPFDPRELLTPEFTEEMLETMRAWSAEQDPVIEKLKQRLVDSEVDSIARLYRLKGGEQ